jgi:hypothetical protein
MSDELDLRYSPPVFSQPAKPATMDERASEPWNAWATALVRNEIRARDKVVINSTVAWVREFVAEKIKGLEEEVASLRADQTIERAHRKRRA